MLVVVIGLMVAGFEGVDYLADTGTIADKKILTIVFGCISVPILFFVGLKSIYADKRGRK